MFGVQFTASFEAHRGEGEDTELHLWDKTSYRKSDEIAAAWDECSFGVIVRSGNKDKLEAVFKALCDKDAAIMLVEGGVFQNAGLCLFIIYKNRPNRSPHEESIQDCV